MEARNSNANEIIIFGVGKRAEQLTPMILSCGYNIKYYVDNNVMLWGHCLHGRKIHNPRVLLGEKEAFVVISSKKYEQDIECQLKEMGIYDRERIVGLTEFLYDIIRGHYVCDSKVEEQKKHSIHILYDFQAFTIQNNGGVSRYYFELIERVKKQNSVGVSLFQGLTNSFFEMDEKCYDQYYTERVDFNDIDLKQAINTSLMREFIKGKKYDIYHPTYYSEIGISGYNNLVITVYDMIHELLLFDKKTSLQKKTMIEKADGIIAISHNTKRDLINCYGIDEKKIKVIYLANSLKSDAGKMPVIREPYILYVGNRAKYKNAELLIKSYANSKCKNEYKLIFAGGGRFSDYEKKLIDDLKISYKVEQISGNDEVLANLYKYSQFFVYPSLYEGFGLPILEAMHYGTPVITSDSSSMKEVAGNAALLFDPDSEESLITAMERFSSDTNLRKEFSKKGLKREKEFSWDRCAIETRDYYSQIVNR